MTGRTVLRLKIGAEGDHTWQAGQLWAAPNTMEWVSANSPADCVVQIDRVTREKMALGVPFAWYGHSFRAQMILKWLREKGMAADLAPLHDPERFQIYLAGNPEHRFCGHDKASTGYALYGGNGYPINTPFSLHDMCKQHDWYADYPTNVTAAAWANMNGVPSVGFNHILTPRGLPIGPGFFVHIDYRNTPYFDDSYTKWTDPQRPNLHYLWAPTYPIARLQSIKWLKFAARSADRAARAAIEAAYNRPAAIPMPTY